MILGIVKLYALNGTIRPAQTILNTLLSVVGCQIANRESMGTGNTKEFEKPFPNRFCMRDFAIFIHEENIICSEGACKKIINIMKMFFSFSRKKSRG